MKGITNWNHSPYIPANRREESKNRPYICRLAPGKNCVSGEWIYPNLGMQTEQTRQGSNTLFVSKRGENRWQTAPAKNGQFQLCGLAEKCEYELYIRSDSGEKSRTRLFATGDYPGICVTYHHPEDEQYDFSGQYTCSPSIVRLPGGALLASCDLFLAAGPQNLQILFRSDDDGDTWHYVTELMPSFWGKLFVHRGELYMLSVSKEYGDVLIGKSEDEGKTWTMPTVIARGSSLFSFDGWHRAPMAMVPFGGRLWSGIEFGSWHNKRFGNSLISVDENADLLNPESWCITEILTDIPAQSNGQKSPAIEGNAVISPEGKLYDFLRVGSREGRGTALILEGSPNKPEERLKFSRYVNFPMGHTKFEILPYNGGYLAIGNDNAPHRNVLSLYRSENLDCWELVKHLMDYKDHDPEYTAFQYPAAFIEDSTLYVLSRTALNGAHNFHDANYITFHKFSI